ncbi:MAG: bifunctional phosphopantothenoylcysteine decarboxylase/phosphopantothenate--cysteine ligase CoaBC, partial [Chloroflexota bacterium]
AIVVEPESGRLASGRVGRGRMAEPSEIVEALRAVLGRTGDLAGRRLIVTAGGTQEPIDPVRLISNRSSGKMGYAIATAARDRGADVVLITAPTTIPIPTGLDVRPVTTALDMETAIHREVAHADALIMAAAVSDYRVASPADQKIKRTADDLVLRLIPNPDIIAGVAGESLVKVGFAAETSDLLANARQKLVKKGLDLIVANDVSSPGSGFGTDTNQVTFLDRLGSEPLPLLAKRDVADRLLDRVVRILQERAAAISPLAISDREGRG